MIINTLSDLARHLGVADSRLEGGRQVETVTHPHRIAVAVERLTRGRAVLSVLSRETYRKPVSRRFRFTESILGYSVQVQTDTLEWLGFAGGRERCLGGDLSDRATALLGLTNGKLEVPGRLAFPTPSTLASRINGIAGGEWAATVNPAEPNRVYADWHTFVIGDGIGRGRTFAVELTTENLPPLVLEYPFDSDRFDAFVDLLGPFEVSE